MKKILKVLMYIVISILLLIIILTVTAKLAENKIAHLAMNKASEIIDAPVAVEKVSFNLLRKFPYATIELQNLSLQSCCISTNPDLAGLDTLVTVGKIYVSVKTKPLLNNEIEIVKVELADTYLHYTVDSTGATPFDFLMTTDTTAVVEEPDTTPSEPLNMLLSDLTLRNIHLTYDDASLKAKAHVAIPEIHVNAKAQNDKYSVTVKGNIALDRVAFEGTNAHLMQQTQVLFDLDYDDGLATIRDLTLLTDGAQIAIAGTAMVTDTITTDLKINTKDINLGELIKYAPQEIIDEFGVEQVAGIVNLSADVKGKYADSTLLPQVNAHLTMKDGAVAAAGYPAIRNLAFDGQVTNGRLQNNQTTSANFKNIHVETGNSSVDLAFSFSNIDHPKYDVATKLKIDIDDFQSFIPDTLLESIHGVVLADLKTRGTLPDSIGDDFTDYAMARSSATITLQRFNLRMDSSLSVRDFSGKFIYTPNRFQVKNLNIQVPEYHAVLENTGLDVGFYGSVNQYEKMRLDIRDVHLQTPKSLISFKAKVDGLDNPEYQFNGHVKMDLAEIHTMMPDSIMDAMSGIVTLDMASTGKILMDSIESQMYDLVFVRSNFKLGLQNLNIKMPENYLTLTNFSGDVNMKDDTITINKVSGQLAQYDGIESGIDFGMDSTEIYNVYKAYLLERKDLDLVVQTNVQLGTISNTFIQAMMASDSTAIDSSAMEPEITDTEAVAENADLEQAKDTLVSDASALMPDFQAMGLPHFLIRGKFGIKQVTYEKNVIDDMSLLFRFSDSLYVVDEFKLKTCGGDLNTSLLFDARKWESPKVDFRNYITNLDIKQLLVDNDNFVAYTGDTLISYENFTGTLTSELHARAFFIKNDWPTDRIRAKGHFTLENGKLYNFQPLVDASVGIGGLKELDKMDFNTLKTSIFLFKDKLYIPKTDVVSNALDLSAFAMQGMRTDDPDYEYHLVLHLGDVLKGKSNKLMEEQEKQNKKDGGTVDRKGLNLVSMKIGDDKKNGFDNDKLKKKFENNLNKQQGFLNLLFNPLLVNFSTDMDRSKKDKEILEKYSTKPGN